MDFQFSVVTTFATSRLMKQGTSTYSSSSQSNTKSNKLLSLTRLQSIRSFPPKFGSLAWMAGFLAGHFPEEEKKSKTFLFIKWSLCSETWYKQLVIEVTDKTKFDSKWNLVVHHLKTSTDSVQTLGLISFKLFQSNDI